MTRPRSGADVLSQHGTREVEGLDRRYRNVYQPRLQTARGGAAFVRFHRGETVASSALRDPIRQSFIAAVACVVEREPVPLITFAKGPRTDDIAKASHARFRGTAGIGIVGKAPEPTPVFGTAPRRNPDPGPKDPWIGRRTARVNHFDVDGLDEDCGAFFLQVCTDFPSHAQLGINGHESVNRQRAPAGIAVAALDHGIRSGADPERLPQLCDGRSAGTIAALLRQWLRRLPHPFPAKDRAVGYRYDRAILQAECSLTPVLARPLSGRVFFAEVIRAHRARGRPDPVPLIFDRRVPKRTPGRFRTRVRPAGVTPSLHSASQHSRLQQSPQEGRAWRTATPIHDPRDFGIGQRLPNLPALRRLGVPANRRRRDVHRLSQACAVGADAFRRVTDPVAVEGQRARGLRFADAAVPALLSALGGFRLFPRGFSSRDLRDHWAPLRGPAPDDRTRGQLGDPLRRLRWHGLIERVPGTHRYRVTRPGSRAALVCTRVSDRLFRPGLAVIAPEAAPDACGLRRGFDQLDETLGRWIAREKVPA